MRQWIWATASSAIVLRRLWVWCNRRMFDTGRLWPSRLHRETFPQKSDHQRHKRRKRTSGEENSRDNAEWGRTLGIGEQCRCRLYSRCYWLDGEVGHPWMSQRQHHWLAALSSQFEHSLSLHFSRADGRDATIFASGQKSQRTNSERFKHKWKICFRQFYLLCIQVCSRGLFW